MKIYEIYIGKTKVNFFDDYIKKEEMEYVLKNFDLVFAELIEKIENNN